MKFVTLFAMPSLLVRLDNYKTPFKIIRSYHPIHPQCSSISLFYYLQPFGFMNQEKIKIVPCSKKFHILLIITIIAFCSINITITCGYSNKSSSKYSTSLGYFQLLSFRSSKLFSCLKAPNITLVHEGIIIYVHTSQRVGVVVHMGIQHLHALEWSYIMLTSNMHR